LFFAHATLGIMTLGSTLARVLGPERPIYALHAEGVDGRAATLDNMREMVAAYVAQIRQARPVGAIRVGGMCGGGCGVAIELARALQKLGRQTGPVILVDPLPVPYLRSRTDDFLRAEKEMYQMLRSLMLHLAEDPRNDTPFDIHDPDKFHAAILAGMAAQIAYAKFVPQPFDGPADLIVTATRAAAFFHPQMPWRRLLPGARTVHVVPWDHSGMFTVGREYIARLIKFMVDAMPTFDAASEKAAAAG
jgi:thioesterase domain-containing protein